MDNFNKYIVYNMLFKGGIKHSDINKLYNAKAPLSKKERIDLLSKEALEIIDECSNKLSNKVKEILDELQ